MPAPQPAESVVEAEPGDAIRLGARSHSADETLVPVDTHPLLAHTTPIGDYLVTREGLEPHPVQSCEPDFDRYVAILRVERMAHGL